MLALLRRRLPAAICLASTLAATKTLALDEQAVRRFRESVQPILESHCYDCHGGGASEAGVAFDGGESGQPPLDDPTLWHRALKQLRAGLMPPEGDELSAAERTAVEQWVLRDAFGDDPERPDPGRVVLRRLNRTEYRNTIRDLVGVEFNADDAFPPDDSGHGFDNLGESLTVSPLLIEKYLAAATKIVSDASHGTGAPASAEASAAIRFLRGDVPSPSELSVARRTALRAFATCAFRRPVDDQTLSRLVELAEAIPPGGDSDASAGMTRAVTAILSSPRFLFRVEGVEPPAPGEHPLVDEFALASRLSYFLWSTMPDDELMGLASAGELRRNLDRQIERMLADPRSEALTRNFAGQWLRIRDLDSIQINAPVIVMRDSPEFERIEPLRRRIRKLGQKNLADLPADKQAELNSLQLELEAIRNAAGVKDFSGELRYSMRREAELHFQYVLQQNRQLLELLDCDYAFLDRRLAEHYGLAELVPQLGDGEPQRVELPAGCRRGGILSQGAFLTVTSNPDRTSPVKRGLYILDNVLGTPPAPPPPNVPRLEESLESHDGRKPTLREALEQHRSDPLCSSCHSRMDPLGLALENFNALGQWRDQAQGAPIDPAGELVTGETVGSPDELKDVLVQRHSREYFECLTQKMLTYALGRGLDYHDVGAVDRIVAAIEADGGRSRALIEGIVRSAPFQRRRADGSASAN
jgi:mono/diheme cytochrome c family protein